MGNQSTIRRGFLESLPVVAALSCVALASNERASTAERRAAVASPVGEVLERVGITPKLGEKLPLDVEFVDSFGTNVKLRDCFVGKPVILHLVYYECPMLCKLSADGLLGTISTLSVNPGADFTVVTISFDPREGPELSDRARDMAIARCGQDAVEGGWHFLTGEEAAIHRVTHAVGFRYMFDETTKQYAHAAGIFVLTPDGTVSRYLAGINYSPRDVRLSLVEASDGKIGTVIEQAMLLCYMYDPTVGKYGLAIMSVVRIFGVLTVVTLGAAIFAMLRRERRCKVGQTAPDSDPEKRLSSGTT